MDLASMYTKDEPWTKDAADPFTADFNDSPIRWSNFFIVSN